jgi:hypothetical protein
MTARIFLLTDTSKIRRNLPRRKLPRAAAGVRDIAADWKRWSWAERIIAVAIVALFVLIFEHGELSLLSTRL